MSEDAKKTILNNVDIISDEIIDMSRKLKENPEIGFKEYKAQKWLTEYLENKNFNVEKSIAGLETSFVARYVCGKGGRRGRDSIHF